MPSQKVTQNVQEIKNQQDIFKKVDTFFQSQINHVVDSSKVALKTDISTPQTVIIKPVNQETKKYICLDCNGKGTLKTQKGCTTCNGLGKVTCNQCSGTGKWGDIYPTKGIYETPQCSMCAGTGKTKCSNCSGNGVITVVTTCPKCNGLGYYFNL